MAHKDIRISFTVENRRYEAVGGFLNEGESRVGGDEMLSRTAGENGGAIGEEDEVFLSKRRSEFPKELQEYHNLATGRRNPDDSRFVSCFHWSVDGWSQGWVYLAYQWDDKDLVLRRCK